MRPPGAGPRCLPPPASRRHQAIGGGPDQRVWRLGWGRVSKSGADRSPTHQNAVSNLPNVRCADQKRGRGPSPHPHRWSVPAVTVAPRGGRAATVSHSAEDGGQRVRGRLLFWVRGAAGPAAGAPPPRARGWQQGARGGRATSGGESLGRGTSTGCGWQRNQWVAPAGQQPSAAARTHPQRQTGVWGGGKRGSPPEAPLRCLPTEGGAGELRPSGGRNVARPAAAPRMDWLATAAAASLDSRRIPTNAAAAAQGGQSAAPPVRTLQLSPRQDSSGPVGPARMAPPPGVLRKDPNERVSDRARRDRHRGRSLPTAHRVCHPRDPESADAGIQVDKPVGRPLFHGSLPYTERAWRARIFTARAGPMQSQRVCQQTPVWGSFCPRWRLFMSWVFAGQQDCWPPHFFH